MHWFRVGSMVRASSTGSAVSCGQHEICHSPDVSIKPPDRASAHASSIVASDERRSRSIVASDDRRSGSRRSIQGRAGLGLNLWSEHRMVDGALAWRVVLGRREWRARWTDRRAEASLGRTAFRKSINADMSPHIMPRAPCGPTVELWQPVCLICDVRAVFSFRIRWLRRSWSITRRRTRPGSSRRSSIRSSRTGS
jgi:hypothetical protein